MAGFAAVEAKDELIEIGLQSHAARGGDKPYARIPIFNYLSPKAFVDAWLSGQGESWRHISWALDERYRDGHIPEALSVERPWAVEVCTLLRARANELGGYRGLQRILRIIPKSLDTWWREEGNASKNDTELDE